MQNLSSLVILIISSILLYILTMLIIKKKNSKKDQISFVFIIFLMCMMVWTFSLIFQILFQNTKIDPLMFESFAAFGACFIPVIFLFIGIVFSRTKMTFQRKHLILFVIPIISTILMFTNKYHHLFYKYYSTNISQGVVGPYFIVNAIYSYLCIFIGLILLLKYSVKNSGFFSKQSILLLIGVSVPLIVNMLGTLNIITLNVYATPISFTIATFFFALAIFKFDFLKVAPIALQRIVDRISDSYLVINDDMIVTDFNQTLLNTFSLTSQDVRNKDIVNIIEKYSKLNIDENSLLSAIDKTKQDDSTAVFEKHFSSIHKYFHVEINSIKDKNVYLGTLILLKDVTQHNEDMKTIRENQEVLIEKERLASLGQMIGGIAHNLKTPIMSIAGAAEGLSDLTSEYRSSVGDPEVTVEDHYAIAHDMDEWISKIRTHLSYMSDIITAVKGQAVNFADNMINGFTVDELIKHVDILMKHELKNALINLNTKIDIDRSTKVDGNINSLVQVINNIISNAIQAYNGKPNESINFELAKKRKLFGNCYSRFCWWTSKKC